MTDDRRNVAVVTGASRGAGRGIAIALGRKGYKVYVTGRSQQEGAVSTLPGTIHATAEEVTSVGGDGVAVAVDHADDGTVARLFEQVRDECGQLDILVNNAAAVKDELTDPGNFWEKPLELAEILNVGLRSHYVASYYAVPLMLPQQRGLIAFTSSFGAGCYMHGAAYGAQKAGTDKMAADMAVDLKEHGIACVSIWMGPLLTERARRTFEAAPDESYREFAANAETPEYPGILIAALADSPKRMEVTGQTLIGAELGAELAVSDANGKQPPSYRSVLGEPRTFHPAIIR